MYDTQLNEPDDTTLNLICKFFKAIIVLCIIVIAIPFMTDILNAVIETRHLFYNTKSTEVKRQYTDSSTVNNNNKKTKDKGNDPQRNASKESMFLHEIMM